MSDPARRATRQSGRPPPPAAAAAATAPVPVRRSARSASAARGAGSAAAGANAPTDPANLLFAAEMMAAAEHGQPGGDDDDAGYYEMTDPEADVDDDESEESDDDGDDDDIGLGLHNYLAMMAERREAGAGADGAAARRGRGGPRITDPLREEQQQTATTAAATGRAPTAAGANASAGAGASGGAASRRSTLTRADRRAAPTAGSAGRRGVVSGVLRARAAASAARAALHAAGGPVPVPVPNATSRALERQANMSPVDAANLGPPTGIRNDEGAMTYYPPLPGGSGGGTGAGPGILTRGRGRNAAAPRQPGAAAGARAAAAAGALGVPGRMIPPAHPAGFPADVMDDFRLRDEGLGAYPPRGYAAYPGGGGAGGMGRFLHREGAGDARSAAAAAGGNDVVDPTALLVACTRRFGRNFYPDPLVPYCGRRLGRTVVPSRDGVCSPLASSRGRVSTCPSCTRLHDSLRLSRLRFMFGRASDIVAPDVDSAIDIDVMSDDGLDSSAAGRNHQDGPVVSDAALVAALRSNSGQFSGTVSLLAKQLGAKPRPHPREVAYVARVLGLPETLARIALKKKDCDTTVAIGWICGFAGSGAVGSSPETSPMTICYQEALQEELRSSPSAAASSETEGSKDAARNTVDEEEMAVLCSLCEFSPSTQSSSKLSSSPSSSSPPSSGDCKKAGLKKTGQEDEDDNNKMNIDNSDAEPIVLDGHCLVQVENYVNGKLKGVLEDGDEETPLSESDRKILQKVLDAKVNVPSPDQVLMKGLANIIAQSKEKGKGKEEGDGLKFVIQNLSPVTQRKLFRYAMENANERCPLCTLPVPSPLAGQRHCAQCQMCEGCIRFTRLERFTKFSVVEGDPSLSVVSRGPRKITARKQVARKVTNGQATFAPSLSSSSSNGVAPAPAASAAPPASSARKAETKVPDDDDYHSEEDEDYDPRLDSTGDEAGDMDLDAEDGFVDESTILWEDSNGKSSSIVHMCCSQPNGSHLHHHPLYLQFTRNKTAHCDIEGPCCTALNRTMRWHVSWSCSVCDFDMCHVCAGKAPPSQPPASRTIPNSTDGAPKTDVDGTFDRRLAVFVPARDATRTATAMTATGGRAKRSILNARTAATAAATTASTLRQATARTTSRRTTSAPSSTSPSSAAAAAAAASTSTRTSPGATTNGSPRARRQRSPAASSRLASAPAASGSSRAAAAGTNGRAAAAAAAGAAGNPTLVRPPAGAMFGGPFAAGAPGLGMPMPLAGLLPVPPGFDPMGYFGQMYGRLGAATLEEMFPPGMGGGAPGLGLIATIDGRGVGVRLRDARGAAARAAGAGARSRRAIEKSQKKKDNKLVRQIWNVEPPTEDAGIVVVNTGNVTPNTETELGSGLLSPASVTDYGRLWLNALLRPTPGGIVGAFGPGSAGAGVSGNPRTPSSMVLLTEDAKAALASFIRHAGADGKQPTPTALDITTAELYCQKLQSLVPARASAVRVKAFAMIAGGKLGLVGTILAAATFAPLALSRAANIAASSSPPSDPQGTPTRSNKKRKRDSSPRGKGKDDGAESSTKRAVESHPTTNVCFCGSPIDLKTAPNGCVGCLRCGHAVHAPCAADLLLGGGVCPACRAPFYQPQLSAEEGQAADDIFQKELLDMDKPDSEDSPSEGGSSSAEKKRDSTNGAAATKDPKKISQSNGEKSSAGTHAIKEGDYVRISPDRELCETVQSTCPTAGGWFPDMADCCGLEGQVIAIVPLGASGAKTSAYRIRIKVPFPPPEPASDTGTDAAKKNKKNAESIKTRGHTFRYTRRCRTLQAAKGNKDGHSSISTACIECHRSTDEMRICPNCETCVTCISRNTTKAEFCTSTVYQCVWNESLLSFTKRGVLPRVYTESASRDVQTKKDDVATATQEAQKHMMRLRSELTAVKSARDCTRTEAESIFASAAVSMSPTDTKMDGGSDGDDNDGGEDGAAAAAMIQLVKDKSKLSLPASIEALTTVMAAKGSPFQFYLAFHLLSLAEQWVSDPSSSASPRKVAASLASEVKAVQKFVVGRNLEAAARHIRSFNTSRVVEQSQWACAYDATGTYAAKAGVQISLLAYPKEGAPRTGFVIEPKARFQATFEHIDADGVVWAQIVEPADWPDSYIASLDDTSQEGYGAVLIGCRVKRGPNWRYGNQDGGEGNEGVIVKARRGLVLVKWNGIESKFRYRYQPKKLGQDSSSSKKEVSIISAIAPPQGWFQVNTFPPSVDRLCTTMQCCACSKDLCATSAKRAVYQRVDPAKLKKGDRVLVAATMEPVIVEEITDLRIHCSFVSVTNAASSTADSNNGKPQAKRTRRSKATALKKNDDAAKANVSAQLSGAAAAAAAAAASACIWYRPVDLVLPTHANSVSEPSHYSSEVRMVAGKLRTMHEVALLHPDDKEGAKKAWEHAGPATDDIHGDIESYASCIKGHLIHPKCFQTALLSGQRCPAPGCGELLWLPSIVRDEEEVTCGGEDGGSTSATSSDTESVRVETNLSSQGEGAKGATSGGGNTDANEFFTEEELAAEGCRMCPACCAGPFLNQHCSDMRTHHGQCSAMAWRSRDGTRRTPCLPSGMTYQVSATEISKRLMQLGNGKTVADVLPRCPTHNVSVMFNGCRGCGHLFTDLSWHNLPKWDPNAKEKAKLDKKKMQASVLLCSQIGKEAAQLEFERKAMKEVRSLATS